MKTIHKAKKVPTAEQLAQMADRGENISQHFTNHGKMMPAIRRVNVDFAENMLKEILNNNLLGMLNLVDGIKL